MLNHLLLKHDYIANLIKQIVIINKEFNIEGDLRYEDHSQNL